MLGGDWTKSETGFRGYPASWITASASRGVGKLGTGAPRAPLEVHVDLSGWDCRAVAVREGPHGPPMDSEARRPPDAPRLRAR